MVFFFFPTSSFLFPDSGEKNSSATHEVRHDDGDRVLEHEGQGEHGQGGGQLGPVRPRERAEVEGGGGRGGGGGPPPRRGGGIGRRSRSRGRSSRQGDGQERDEGGDDARDEDGVGLVELPGREHVARRAKHRREERRRERQEEELGGGRRARKGQRRKGAADGLRDDLGPAGDVGHEQRLVQEDVAEPGDAARAGAEVRPRQAQQRAAAAARRAQEPERRLREEQARGDRERPGADESRGCGAKARGLRDGGDGEHAGADSGACDEGSGVEHGAGRVLEVVVEGTEQAASSSSSCCGGGDRAPFRRLRALLSPLRRGNSYMTRSALRSPCSCASSEEHRAKRELG